VCLLFTLESDFRRNVMETPDVPGALNKRDVRRFDRLFISARRGRPPRREIGLHGPFPIRYYTIRTRIMCIVEI